jgi:hypothetical protein
MPYKDIYWYLEQVGGMEVFHFNDHSEAKNFGDTLRKNEPNVEVEIGATHVRVRLLEELIKTKKKRF